MIRSAGAFRRCPLVPLLVVLLAACAMPLDDGTDFGPKRIAVDHAVLDHEVRFAAGRADLSGAERERLARFLRTVGTRRGDRFTVRSAPGADPVLVARRLAVLRALIGDVSLAPAGLATAASGRSQAPVDLSGRHGDAVGVRLMRPVLGLPDCPDWSAGSISGPGNPSSSNFGCATAVNLGLMVADPNDLVQGRAAATGFDAERAARTVERYRRSVGGAVPPGGTPAIPGGGPASEGGK